MSTPSKRIFRLRKSQNGQRAKAVAISFYPQHLEVLRTRERELNVPRSVIVQLLLELEQKDGLVRRELIARLTGNAAEAKGPTPPNL